MKLSDDEYDEKSNKAIAIDSNGVGVINFEVPQSLDEKGTTVTFTLTDNALNTKTESYVFYVDNTPPKASLEIEKAMKAFRKASLAAAK